MLSTLQCVSYGPTFLLIAVTVIAMLTWIRIRQTDRAFRNAGKRVLVHPFIDVVGFHNPGILTCAVGECDTRLLVSLRAGGDKQQTWLADMYVANDSTPDLFQQTTRILPTDNIKKYLGQQSYDSKLFSHHKYWYTLLDTAVDGSRVIVQLCEIDKILTSDTTTLGRKTVLLQTNKKCPLVELTRAWAPLGPSPTSKNTFLFQVSVQPHIVVSVDLTTGIYSEYSRSGDSRSATSHLDRRVLVGTNPILMKNNKYLAVGKVQQADMFSKSGPWHCVFYEFDASPPYTLTRASAELTFNTARQFEEQTSGSQEPSSLSNLAPTLSSDTVTTVQEPRWFDFTSPALKVSFKILPPPQK